MKVRTIMTYVIVVVAIILVSVLLYKFKKNMDEANKEISTGSKGNLLEVLISKGPEDIYPYFLEVKKSAKVNNTNLYEFKFKNEGDLYIESIIISFIFLDENKEVIGIEVKEYIDIPSKMIIEELVTLNNGRSFHDYRWFVLGMMTQE